MDNYEQVLAIHRYWKHLCKTKSKQIGLEIAASLWIDKYAGFWRQKNPVEFAEK